MFKRSVKSGVLIVSAIVLGALLALPLIAQAPGWSCRIHLPPNPYSFHKEDLEKLMWIEIANGEKEPTPVYLHGEIKRDGKLVARANSNRIEIPPGGKKITRGDITKLTDEWWDPELEKTLIRVPMLPEGKYEACVYVYKWGGKELLTKCCISFESKPVSPPRLIAPKDGAKVIEPRPTFIWTPATGIPEVHYAFLMKEKHPGQTVEEAMKSNPWFFVEKGITTTSYILPNKAPNLEPGSEYCWTVLPYPDDDWPFPWPPPWPPSPMPPFPFPTISCFTYTGGVQPLKITTLEEFKKALKGFKNILPPEQYVDLKEILITRMSVSEIPKTEIVTMSAPVRMKKGKKATIEDIHTGKYFFQVISYYSPEPGYNEDSTTGKRTYIPNGIYLVRMRYVDLNAGRFLAELVPPEEGEQFCSIWATLGGAAVGAAIGCALSSGSDQHTTRIVTINPDGSRIIQTSTEYTTTICGVERTRYVISSCIRLPASP